MLSLIYLIQAYSNKNMFFSKSRKSYQLASDHLGTYVKNRLVFLEMNVKKHILTKYPNRANCLMTTNFEICEKIERVK